MFFEKGYTFETESFTKNDKIKSQLEIELKFEILNILGRGKFGQVCQVKHLKSNDNYALKIIEFYNVQERIDIENEIKIMQMIDHPHIVKYYGRFMHSIDKQCIVMEFCELGDLRYFISEKSFKNGSSADYYLTNNQVKLEWSIELFEGLFYIHSEKIIHRDINPNNVFLFFNKQKNQISIKIGDLGQSKEIKGDHMTSLVGTKFYFSPEMVIKQEYTAKTDVWSAGCTIYEMVRFKKAFENPFSFEDPVASIEEYIEISDAVIFGMLEKDDKKRKNSTEILAELNIIKESPSKRTIQNPGNYEKVKELCEKINGQMEFVDYYIQRQLKRFIRIDRKILEKEKHNFKIVYSEEDFKVKCQEHPNESVHYLKIEKENQNLIWEKSYGSIFNIEKCLIKKETSCLFIDEDQLLKQGEKILIISADPGMGKSTILDKIICQNSNPDTFFIKIVLNNHTKTLKELKECKITVQGQDIMDFILISLFGLRNSLNISLLKQLAKEEKLILMFDGVDEVIDYKVQVKILIEMLTENYKLKKILITTRSNLKQDLENNFKTISYNLNSFTAKDQKSFLIQYWKNLNKNLNENLLEISAKYLIEKLNSNLKNDFYNLIGIPLQTKMIADIFFDEIKSKDILKNVQINNVAELYHEFMEKKFDIQFEEKSKIEITRNEDLYQEQKEKFYEGHIKLSVFILLEAKEETVQILNEREEKAILKYGLISEFRNKIPKFLHQSYAEYLVAKSSLNKLIRNQDEQEINEILKKGEYLMVRKFLNDLMIKNEENFRDIQKASPTRANYNTEIENCCIENLIYILKYLIDVQKADIKIDNRFLVLAAEKGHIKIVELLLEKGVDINQKNFKKQNALHIALEKGHIKLVGLLIKKGIAIDHQDSDGWNALHWASLNGHKEIATFLIEQGIDINQKEYKGWNALHLASSEGHEEIVKLLIQNGINVNVIGYEGKNALHLAIEYGHRDLVKFLIEKGIDCNQKDRNGSNALHWASFMSQKEIVELLIKNGINVNEKNKEGKNALHLTYESIDRGIEINQIDENSLGLTSSKGHVEIAKLLIERGIDIHQQDKFGCNVLHCACRNGHTEIVRLLLEKGCDINQKDKNGCNALHITSDYGHREIAEILLGKKTDTDQRDINGRSSLHLASRKGHLEIIKLLLDKGVDINQKDKTFGYDSLHFAALYNQKKVIELLIENGIDLNHTDNYWKRNALHLASCKGHKESVELLIEKGFDINQKDKDGNNALDWASFYGHEGLVEFLKLKQSLY